jgi:hypothetical protein
MADVIKKSDFLHVNNKLGKARPVGERLLVCGATDFQMASFLGDDAEITNSFFLSPGS